MRLGKGEGSCGCGNAEVEMNGKDLFCVGFSFLSKISNGLRWCDPASHALLQCDKTPTRLWDKAYEDGEYLNKAQVENRLH